MKVINVSDRLPPEDTYVLAHLTLTNWIEKKDTEGGRLWRVVKLIKGISKEDRRRMIDGDLADPRTTVHTYYNETHSITDVRRSSTIRAEDEGWNNLVPFIWDEFGPGCYFGQEVDAWCELPPSPKNKEGKQSENK